MGEGRVGDRHNGTNSRRSPISKVCGRICSRVTSWSAIAPTGGAFPSSATRTGTTRTSFLLGDALHTAHFSIGSGTKLAMEDAINLYNAFDGARSVAEALATFQGTRREDVEKTQYAANVSALWTENPARYWGMDPIQACFSMLSRAKAVTYENLRMRDPAIRRSGAILVCRRGSAPGFRRSARQSAAADVHAVSDRPDGGAKPRRCLADEHVFGGAWRYSRRLSSGPSRPLRHGRRRPSVCGNDRSLRARRASRPAVPASTPTSRSRRGNASATSFIARATPSSVCSSVIPAAKARRAAAGRAWTIHLPDANWEVVAASALAFHDFMHVPREITRAEMERVRDDYARAAANAERAGFDMIELHCGHGYLLSGFISPLSNERTDEYGGSLENRMRFPLEVFDTVRAHWPRHKPISVRISATDWAPGGITPEAGLRVAAMFKAARRRHSRCIGGNDLAVGKSGLWPDVPDAVVGDDPQRSRRCRQSRSAPSRRRIRSTPLLPPAVPIYARWRGRT